MIEFEVERFVWDPGPCEFRRVTDEQVLVDVPAKRHDVSRERLAAGWSLLTTVQLEQNAQQFVEDLWTRTDRRRAETSLINERERLGRDRQMVVVLDGFERSEPIERVAEASGLDFAAVGAIYAHLRRADGSQA